MNIPSPSQDIYPKSYKKFGAFSDVKVLQGWFEIILGLLESAESMVTEGSASVITIQHIDALSLSCADWNTAFADPKEIEDKVYAVFMLGIAGLYRSSQMSRWTEKVSFMTSQRCTGIFAFLGSKGGELVLRVIKEAAKNKQ